MSLLWFLTQRVEISVSTKLRREKDPNPTLPVLPSPWAKEPYFMGFGHVTPLGPVKGISVHFIKYKSMQGFPTWIQGPTSASRLTFCSPRPGATPKPSLQAFQSTLEVTLSSVQFLHFQPRHTTCYKNGVNGPGHWRVADSRVSEYGNMGRESTDREQGGCVLRQPRLHLQSRMLESFSLMHLSNPVLKENGSKLSRHFLCSPVSFIWTYMVQELELS